MSNTEKNVGDVVGLREIAPLLEVGKRTPNAWWDRKRLPMPDHPHVNGLRAWKRDTIVHWAATTGRLPESGSLDAEAAKFNVTAPKHRGGREHAAKAREAVDAS